MTQVVVGEAVALDLRTAALPSRIVAALIDATLQVLLLVALVAAFALAGSRSAAADAAIGVGITVLAFLAYPVAWETATRGRTPGKMAMGLRVVRDDGGPISFRHAFVRGMAGLAVERPGITFFFAAFFTSLGNRQGKRVGDLLAGTVVLQERVPGGPPVLAEVPEPLVGWARGLDLSGVSPDLVASAREFSARAGELSPAARDELGGRLVREVVARLGTPPPDGTPGWAVLAAVLGERRRREQERLGGTAQAAAPAPAPPPAPAPASAAPPVPAAPAAPAPPAATGGFAPPG